jgi:hypothetical protein
VAQSRRTLGLRHQPSEIQAKILDHVDVLLQGRDVDLPIPGMKIALLVSDNLLGDVLSHRANLEPDSLGPRHELHRSLRWTTLLRHPRRLLSEVIELDALIRDPIDLRSQRPQRPRPLDWVSRDVLRIDFHGALEIPPG